MVSQREEGPHVPVAMLVAGPEAAEPVVGPDAAERLARLGITRVALLGDPSGIGVVMEGWAFDPAHVNEAVRIVFPDGYAAIRVFREIEQVAVTMVEVERST
jgi:hypothetical protein